jgi:hypothetical protein
LHFGTKIFLGLKQLFESSVTIDLTAAAALGDDDVADGQVDVRDQLDAE